MLLGTGCNDTLPTRSAARREVRRDAGPQVRHLVRRHRRARRAHRGVRRGGVAGDPSGGAAQAEVAPRRCGARPGIFGCARASSLVRLSMRPMRSLRGRLKPPRQRPRTPSTCFRPQGQLHPHRLPAAVRIGRDLGAPADLRGQVAHQLQAPPSAVVGVRTQQSLGAVRMAVVDGHGQAVVLQRQRHLGLAAQQRRVLGGVGDQFADDHDRRVDHRLVQVQAPVDEDLARHPARRRGALGFRGHSEGDPVAASRLPPDPEHFHHLTRSGALRPVSERLPRRRYSCHAARAMAVMPPARLIHSCECTFIWRHP